MKKADLIQSLRDLKMTYPNLRDLNMTIQVLRDLEMTHQKDQTHPSLERLEMTHQVCTPDTLDEERFYVPGALVMASSLRRTEIKQVLSVRSLQTF